MNRLHHVNIHTGILKIITEMFLPHIGLSELEDECFSKILPKVNGKYVLGVISKAVLEIKLLNYFKQKVPHTLFKIHTIK